MKIFDGMPHTFLAERRLQYSANARKRGDAASAISETAWAFERMFRAKVKRPMSVPGTSRQFAATQSPQISVTCHTGGA